MNTDPRALETFREGLNGLIMKQAQARLCAELSGSSLADPLSPERKATATLAADLDAWITCVGAVPRATTKRVS